MNAKRLLTVALRQTFMQENKSQLNEKALKGNILNIILK